MNMKTGFIVLSVCLLFGAGCRVEREEPTGDLALSNAKVVKGFDIPESAVVDLENDCLYVPNCAGDREKTWEDDGDGYISKLARDGSKVLEKEWLASRPDAVLNDPKALSIFNGYLYICDNKRLLKVKLDGSKKLEEVKLDNSGGLGDSVVLDDHLYVGDGANKSVFKIAKDGTFDRVKGVEGINGLAEFKGRLFAVSWALHDIYEVDLSGKNAPKSFNLADNFINLDGIVTLDDGTFIVSDFMGNAIYGLSSDRQKLRKLAEVESPADIALDAENNLLYVPSYFEAKVTIYELELK